MVVFSLTWGYPDCDVYNTDWLELIIRDINDDIARNDYEPLDNNNHNDICFAFRLPIHPVNIEMGQCWANALPNWAIIGPAMVHYTMFIGPVYPMLSVIWYMVIRYSPSTL